MSFCWNEINSGVKSLILILCMLSLMTLSLWDDVATKFFMQLELYLHYIF